MNFKIKSIALAVGLSAGSIVVPAHAIPVSVDVIGSVSLTSNGATTINSVGPATTVDVSEHGNYIYGEAKGNNNGWSALYVNAFEDSTSGNNALHASSSLRQIASVTNNTSSAQNFTFDFTIDTGSIGTDSGSLTGNDYLSASYSASILVNGIDIWNSSATQLTSATGSQLFKSGTDLNGFEYSFGYSWGNNYYNWMPFSDSLSLGTFGAGETFTLEYVINSSVSAVLSECEYWIDNGYGCYDNANAGFGDPFNFNTTPVFSPDNFTVTPADPGNPTDVPEPAGTLLLGAGLAALAFRRRKERKTTL